MARGMFRKFWVEPRPRENVARHETEGDVIVPSFKQVVEI